MASYSHLKKTFLTLLLLGVSPLLSAAYFCGGEGEPPAGCGLEDALRHYKASPENADFLGESVGLVRTRRTDGENYGATGFIVRTENCTGNDLIFTNAHSFFDCKTGKLYAKSSKFCLNGKCYKLDLDAIPTMDRKGMLGAKKLTSKERSLDYIVVPIKGKKRPAPKAVATLADFHNAYNFNKPMMFAGYHIDKKDVYFVQGCKITHNLEENLDAIFHNCPGKVGFSGGPLINRRIIHGREHHKIVAFHASDGKGKNGQPYNPYDKRFNRGGAISQDLIDNLNSYCSEG